MQKIVFNILGVYSQFYQANVKIFHNNKLIKEGFTCNGKITFCLEKNCGYKVIVTVCNKKVVRSIYTSINYFNININDNCNVRNRIITFLLTDLNYYNLPIEKGEIIIG